MTPASKYNDVETELLENSRERAYPVVTAVSHNAFVLVDEGRIAARVIERDVIDRTILSTVLAKYLPLSAIGDSGLHQGQ